MVSTKALIWHHAPAQEHRPEIPQHCPDGGRRGVERGSETAKQGQHGRQAAPGTAAPLPDHGARPRPRPLRRSRLARAGESITVTMMARFHITGADVRQQEPAVTVEHAKAPGGQDQQAGAREEDSHQRTVRSRFAPSNPPAMRSVSGPARSNATEDDQRGDQRQQAEHGVGQPVRLFGPSFGRSRA